MADGTKLEDEAAQSTTALGPMIGLAREDFVGAIAVLLRETATDPQRTMKHAQEMGQDMIKIMTGKSDLAPDPRDKRFKDPAWQYNPFFRAGAQYFLAVQKGMSSWLNDLDLDDLERDRANFISNIIIDSLAPTNTLVGNPTAQKRLIDSGGLSLVKGLKNAYNDMVHNKGMVSMVDKRPFKLGEKMDDPLQMYLSDIYTISANLAGLPGLSIPCGHTSANLPVGLQLLGKTFDEATLLAVAHQFQQATDHHTKFPGL